MQQRTIIVEAVGGDLDVFVNGSRRASVEGPDYVLTMVGVEEVLIGGENLMTATFHPSEAPVRPVRFRVRLAQMDMSGMVSTESGETIASVGWELAEATPEDGPTVTRQARFDLAAGSLWDWPWTRELELTDALREELDVAVRRLGELVEARDLATLEGLFEPYFAAMERNYGSDEAWRREELRGLLSNEAIPLRLEPIATVGAGAYRAVAGGRLIELSDGDGRPLLRLAPFEDADGDLQRLELPIMLWRGPRGRLRPAL